MGPSRELSPARRRTENGEGAVPKRGRTSPGMTQGHRRGGKPCAGASPASSRVEDAGRRRRGGPGTGHLPQRAAPGPSGGRPAGLPGPAHAPRDAQAPGGGGRGRPGCPPLPPDLADSIGSRLKRAPQMPWDEALARRAARDIQQSRIAMSRGQDFTSPGRPAGGLIAGCGARFRPPVPFFVVGRRPARPHHIRTGSPAAGPFEAGVGFPQPDPRRITGGGELTAPSGGRRRPFPPLGVAA
jgi:hypothetical protein